MNLHCDRVTRLKGSGREVDLDLNEAPRRNRVGKITADRVCRAIEASGVCVYIYDNVDITIVVDPDGHVTAVAGVSRVLDHEAFHDLVHEVQGSVDVVVRDDR